MVEVWVIGLFILAFFAGALYGQTRGARPWVRAAYNAGRVDGNLQVRYASQELDDPEFDERSWKDEFYAEPVYDDSVRGERGA